MNYDAMMTSDEDETSILYKLNSFSIGDPGLGKSQLLQAAAAVSPRGIYVCGNATTKAGLTVAVVKDPMTNDYAFEAGKFSSFSSTQPDLFLLALLENNDFRI